MPVTDITKSRIMRVLVLNQFIIAPTGSAKIIWESDRAQFRPLGCSAGKMSAIIARTLIALLPDNLRVNRAKISRIEMKRTERIALSLRTRDGVSASELKDFAQELMSSSGSSLLRQSNGNFVLTRKGKVSRRFRHRSISLNAQGQTYAAPKETASSTRVSPPIYPAISGECTTTEQQRPCATECSIRL